MAASRLGSQLRTVLTAIGALTFVLTLLAFSALLFADRWWHDADQPIRADAIIVLGGAPERPMYAADLYRQGYSPIVYVSRPALEREHKLLEEHGIMLPTEEEINRAILLKRGVAEHAIRVFSAEATNTLDEAHIALVAIPANVRTILVVTSPNHARRARIIFSDIFAKRGTRVVVVANPYEPHPAHWWSEKESARQTIVELTKTVLYALGIRYSN